MKIEHITVRVSYITVVSAVIVGFYRFEYTTSVQVVHVQYSPGPDIHTVIDHQWGACSPGPHGARGILDERGHPLEVECLVICRELYRIDVAEAVGRIVISFRKGYGQIIGHSAE